MPNLAAVGDVVARQGGSRGGLPLRGWPLSLPLLQPALAREGGHRPHGHGTPLDNRYHASQVPVCDMLTTDAMTMAHRWTTDIMYHRYQYATGHQPLQWPWRTAWQQIPCITGTSMRHAINRCNNCPCCLIKIGLVWGNCLSLDFRGICKYGLRLWNTVFCFPFPSNFFYLNKLCK
jgi:hypothetical protein